jgi:serine-type D-Ala-D-Ala carboxypeptidase/endopeptidase
MTMVCLARKLVAVCLFIVTSHSLRVEGAPWKSQVQTLAEAYLAKRTNCGLVIGTARAGESDIQGFGRLDNGRAPDASTIFEIGSITKVFTAITLQTIVAGGLLKLEDRADKYLPNGLRLPEREGRAITLLDLATHSSGLQRLPDNLKISENPYAKYGSSELYECLRRAKLRRKPGEDYEYSNLGFGLLGHLLELRAGKPYAAVVRERLLLPLGMTNTVVTLSADHRARLAHGHGHKGAPTGNWDFDALAGAGAFRSSAADMMRFLSANLRPERSPLADALTAAQKTHFRGKSVRIGLGWHNLDTKDGLKVVWHNGGTGGYVSFLGFAPKEQVGVVVLSNYGDALANDSSLDKLAIEILTALNRSRAE